jgi:hypothetical protein
MSDSLSGNFAVASQLRDTLLKHVNKGQDSLKEQWHAGDVARLKQLVSYSFSNAYEARKTEFNDRFRKALTGMPDFRQTASRWTSLSQTQRLEFLNRCLTTIAGLQSENGITVRAPSLRWGHDRRGEAAGFGLRFSDIEGRGDVIQLDSYPQALNTESLSQALASVVKQQRYIYQACLVRAYRHDRIDSNHPLSQDAQTLSDLYHDDALIDKRIMSAWLKQPHEMDAAGVAYSIRNFVERFEAKPDVHTRIRNNIEQRRP